MAEQGVVLDTGALIAVERRDRVVGAMLRTLQQQRVPLATSSAAVAQVWRGGSGQANLARVLAGVASRPLDDRVERRIGELLGSAEAADVVDAHVALLVPPGGTVLTSDPEDIRHLLTTRGVAATIVPV